MDEIPVIRTDSELADFAGAVGGSAWIAIDTEFMRERTYLPLLCLIQITDGVREACIDALAVQDLSPLGELLAAPAPVKIFHSCRQDLEALETRLCARIRNLYDTQLAAAFCNCGEQVSYAALVESMCAVHLPKSHTRADWSRRPLQISELQYAIEDVRYLQPVRLQLDRLMQQNGHAEWHRAECDYAADPANHHFDPVTAWTRIKGATRLKAPGQVCAQKLTAWREGEARRRNLPRTWVLQNPALLRVCRKLPDTPTRLSNIPGIGRAVARHSGAAILAVVAESKSQAPARPLLKGLSADDRRRIQEIMRLIARLAEHTGISQALITSRPEVENFVRGQAPQRLFQDWRRQLVGEEILARYC